MCCRVWARPQTLGFFPLWVVSLRCGSLYCVEGVNHALERILKEAVPVQLRCYLGIYFERLRKTTKNLCEDSRWFGRDQKSSVFHTFCSIRQHGLTPTAKFRGSFTSLMLTTNTTNVTRVAQTPGDRFRCRLNFVQWCLIRVYPQ
jgi:hypothetical protein